MDRRIKLAAIAIVIILGVLTLSLATITQHLHYL